MARFQRQRLFLYTSTNVLSVNLSYRLFRYLLYNIGVYFLVLYRDPCFFLLLFSYLSLRGIWPDFCVDSDYDTVGKICAVSLSGFLVVATVPAPLAPHLLPRCLAHAASPRSFTLLAPRLNCRQRLGTAGRLWVVVVSNALAAPFAVGVLLAPYPWCFICFLGAELLGEMWVLAYSILLLKLLHNRCYPRSTGGVVITHKTRVIRSSG